MLRLNFKKKIDLNLSLDPPSNRKKKILNVEKLRKKGFLSAMIQNKNINNQKTTLKSDKKPGMKELIKIQILDKNIKGRENDEKKILKKPK